MMRTGGKRNSGFAGWIGRRHVGRAIAVVVGATLIAVFGLDAAASARLNYADYTVEAGYGCSTNHKSDPVNIIFQGSHGDFGNATRHLDNHTGRGTHDQGNQAVYRYGACDLQDSHREDACGARTRFHIRLWGLPFAYTPGPDHYTVAGAHHEHDCVFSCFLPCHAIDSSPSGFDYGRGTVRVAFANGGHSTDYFYRGNTETFRQCDGNRVGGDGNVATIEVNSIQP